MIHSEFMTHRTISRNASSSRAIPVKKQIQMVIDNPAVPLAFTKNQKGMQGGEALSGDVLQHAYTAWLDARDAAVIQAQILADLEVHKQYANRILEPFSHITVVATATDWNNFFALRCHEMAQPEIHDLADKMYAAREANIPTVLKEGQWHLPFCNIDDECEIYNGYFEGAATNEQIVEIMIKRSVARCARVSYMNHDGTETTVEQDLQLYDRLLGSSPIHASPAEHQAQALNMNYSAYVNGNLRGWIQYRKTLKNENIQEFKK
jgi:thymidylate synthase ThyX